MTQNKFLKLLLLPFSLVYGIGISFRNAMYESGMLKSTKFNIPVISVGNLSIGGAGKTPHIEYLLDFLSPFVNVAVLSRGYKRETKGFRIVSSQNTASKVGDEPLMFRRKHHGIVVAVGENRALAIPEIIAEYPNTETILLDDAFQHRSVEPGLNILLTTFDNPFTEDYLLPAGRLREWRRSYHRADVIIVTKCPHNVSPEKLKSLKEKINPYSHQKLFFSYYEYGYPYSIFTPNFTIKLDKELDVFLISAIASTQYLIDYLKKEVKSIHQLEYVDHHQFTPKDIEYIIDVFQKRDTHRKIILTTEKDMVRLEPFAQKLKELNIPIFVLPISVKFVDGQNEFLDVIKSYLLNFKR